MKCKHARSLHFVLITAIDFFLTALGEPVPWVPSVGSGALPPKTPNPLEEGTGCTPCAEPMVQGACEEVLKGKVPTNSTAEWTAPDLPASAPYRHAWG